MFLCQRFSIKKKPQTIRAISGLAEDFSIDWKGKKYPLTLNLLIHLSPSPQTLALEVNLSSEAKLCRHKWFRELQYIGQLLITLFTGIKGRYFEAPTQSDRAWPIAALAQGQRLGRENCSYSFPWIRAAFTTRSGISITVAALHPVLNFSPWLHEWAKQSPRTHFFSYSPRTLEYEKKMRQRHMNECLNINIHLVPYILFPCLSLTPGEIHFGDSIAPQVVWLAGVGQADGLAWPGRSGLCVQQGLSRVGLVCA